jgi:hypothetical protein
METERFDRLTRGLAADPSRRDLIRVLAGLALGGAAAARMADAEAKKCGPCKKKKKGKCKKKKPNDTPCETTGKCLNGTCNQPPTCQPAFALACFDGGDCCSGACLGIFPNSNCGQGAQGTPCFTNNDCTSNSCIGFVCQ